MFWWGSSRRRRGRKETTRRTGCQGQDSVVGSFGTSENGHSGFYIPSDAELIAIEGLIFIYFLCSESIAGVDEIKNLIRASSKMATSK